MTADTIQGRTRQTAVAPDAQCRGTMLPRLPGSVHTAPVMEAAPPRFHILAVDDDPSMRQMIADYLADNDILVTVAESGKEIAEKYNMSEDLVYQRARRLKVRLMNWLSERGITSAESLLTSTVAK